MVEESVLGEAFHWWDGGARTGGNDDVSGDEPAAVDFDLVARDQPGIAFDDIDAESAELLGVVVWRDAAALLPHRLHDRARCHLHVDRCQAIVAGVAHLMNELRRGDEGLGRYAAGPEAVAAEGLALDERRAPPEARTPRCRDQPPGAAPDDHDVEVLGHARILR